MRKATFGLAFLSAIGLYVSPVPLRANITPVARGHVQTGTVLPTTSTDVRVLSERLTVDITPSERNRHATPIVSVVADYAMRHEGKEPVNLEIAFPFAGAFETFSAFYGTPRPTEGLGYLVTLDSDVLPARDEALPLPRTARSNTWGIGYSGPDEAESQRLKDAFTKWVASDAELSALLAEYSRMAPSWEKSHQLRTALDAGAKRPATPPADVEALRVELAREENVQLNARRFMVEKVMPRIQNKSGLGEFTIKRLARYLPDAYNPNPRGYSEKTGWAPRAKSLPSFAPDEWLVAQLDPEIERERVRRISEADALLDRYGFDSTFISPLTGLGYSQRVGWRDDSTWATLGFNAPPTRDEQSIVGRHSFERGTYRTIVDSPRSEAKLIRFAVPFKPGQSRTLRVSYKALAEVDELVLGHPYGSQIVHVRYILKTAQNWKSFGPIDLTVTLPNSGLVVTEPATNGPRDLDRSRVQYTAKLDNPQSNLRIAWAPVVSEAQSGFGGDTGRSQLFSVSGEDLPDLRKLLDATKHPQARRALTALIAIANRPADPDARHRSTLREPGNLILAGFTPAEAFRLRWPGDTRSEAQRMYEHVYELAEIGWSYMTIHQRPENTFTNAPVERISRWSPEDRRIAAELAAAIKSQPKTPAARLARCYIAMLATDRPTDAQARAFMDAARAAKDDQQLAIALGLINEYPGDPRPFRPLVDELAARPKPDGKDKAAHNFYVTAQGTAMKIDRYKPPAPAVVTEAAHHGKRMLEAATRAAPVATQPAR